jgi:hypothetical protein
MRNLRNEMHRSMLRNGYYARPVEMYSFEAICEFCSFSSSPSSSDHRARPKRPTEDLRGHPQTPQHHRVVTAALDTITRRSKTSAASCTASGAVLSKSRG